MRIIFLGSGAFAIPTLRWLMQSEHQVPLVVTQPARPAHRGRSLTPTPVAELAKEQGLEVLETTDINAPEVVDQLCCLKARLLLAIAFGQKLGSAIMESTPGGAINLHASLLPSYRGAAPINWAIIHGEERTGCTVFKIVERMDAGPILTSRWTLIKPDESAGQLHDRLAGIGVDAVRDAVEQFEEGAIPEGVAQDESEASSAPKFKKSDGFVRFDRDSIEISDRVRGLTPWPGATAVFHGSEGRCERVTFRHVRPAENPAVPTIAFGTIDPHYYVAVREGFLEILSIQPSSGREMSWPDFVNGRHVKPGDRFATPDLNMP